jgi:hypothetical protein
MAPSDFYMVKEYTQRELFGYNLPDRIFPKRHFSLIKISEGEFEVNRFNNIAALAKFWFNSIGDERSDESPISDRLPENYNDGRLAKLTSKEFADFFAYYLKEAGPIIWLP